MDEVLRAFSPATREWFGGAFAEPTAAQAGAWEAIARGDHTLVVAPTGSGKTLAAFLWSIDRIAFGPGPATPPAPPAPERPSAGKGPVPRCRVLYVSPLKALAVDVERNLRAPLTGVRQAARRLGLPVPEVSVALRSGDTPADERRRLAARPPEILITTPESLFLILTSRARDGLRGVETVIVDEVHAVAGTKRGSHLALSLERLDALLERPAQRIGLSATVRPVEEVAAFLAGAGGGAAGGPEGLDADGRETNGGVANSGGRAADGGDRAADGTRVFAGARPVTIVQPAHGKEVALQIVVPIEDLTELAVAPPPGAGRPDGPVGAAADHQVGGPDGSPPGPDDTTIARRSVWPHVENRVLDLIEAHRSTIVFANSRRLAERLCGRLNELAWERATGEELRQAGDRPPAELMAQAGTGAGAPREIARAHHGSVSKEERAGIEEALKAGRLPAVVATSSLELGIDMGAVDLVVQVGSPPSVAGGLQRVGRAGHQVGAVSKGVIFPKYRGDLVQTAVVADRMRDGLIEELRYPRNPLDVLAQQIVAMVAMDEWSVDDLERLVRRAAPYAALPRSALEATLDMLAGRYPSDEFGELRPRLVWDRVTGVLRARPGAQRLAVTSGGTIPDRGLFGVFLVGEKTSRVGELDEEMVYESRVGDVFVLGATSWRIEEITPDRVLVSPAPGRPGKLPFWHGDTAGRPAELGRALGAFSRELAALEPEKARARVGAAGLDAWAAGNLVSYLAEQREATGYVPDDRTLVVERFRDELGDWRLVIHSPFGARVHGPWALAIASRLRERHGLDAQALHADDGIVLRVPDTDTPPGADLALFDPEDIERVVVDEVGGSALFAARFRECAARSLLLPRRRPDRRVPLWQQRQRSAQLLAVASKYASFPVVLETVRECMQDVFDVPELVRLMRDLAGRTVRLVEVETPVPSPFARSLLFNYVGAFMYEGDAPLAERRAQALALDSTLLAELLGQADLRELLDPDVVAETVRELQRLAPDRRARDLEGVADLLRVLGPSSAEEIAERCTTVITAPAASLPGTASPPGSAAAVERTGVTPADRAVVDGWLSGLEADRRAIRVRIAGAQRWAAIEDAGRLRDALGVPVPVGVPEAFLEPVDDPLGDLVSRYARTHGPFRTLDAAARLGLGAAVVTGALRRLAQAGRVAEGEFLPVTGLSGPVTTEWCDLGVLRLLRRRSLARLRAEVEPSPPEALARFLPSWQGVGGTRLRGIDALVQAIEQLQGAAIPASALESLVLPSRVPGYTPALLDELTSAGEVVWAGQGGLPGGDGWISLYLADAAPALLPEPADITMTPLHEAILGALPEGTALFFRLLSDRVNTSDPGIAPGSGRASGSGPATPHAVIRPGPDTTRGPGAAPRHDGDDGDGARRDEPGRADPAARATDQELITALWDLVWAGLLTNDTLAPLRAALGSGRPAHRPRGTRRGRPVLPSRAGPPTAAGRWWALPAREPVVTRRAHAYAEVLLERYGIVIRGAVAAERAPGGFAAVYPVLSALEESGRCRRGYFVEGLGAAQFAVTGAVDRLRALREPRPALSAEGGGWGAPTSARDGAADTVVLAAADPANPYGAALPWPVWPVRTPGDGDGAGQTATGHRPGRKAGSLVVLVDGRLVLYVERGGRSVLCWAAEPGDLDAAVEALARSVRQGTLGGLTIERADGVPISDSHLAGRLEAVGFHPTPRGLRLRN